MKIDKIYVISLEANNREAQLSIIEKIDALNMPYPIAWEIVPGFDGRSGELPEGYNLYPNWNLGDKTWNDWWKRDVTGGEAGCAISHTMVWRKIIEDQVETALILEDDFKLVRPLDQTIVPDVEWDIAYLGRHALFPGDETLVVQNWVNALSSYNTHAYVIKKGTARVLLTSYDYSKNIITPDEFLTATYTEHRREDIAQLFPPKLKAIAPTVNYMEQDRPHEQSNTEPTDANINLMREETKPYFEILDDADWDQWKSKYLNHTLAKGEYDLMIDDIGNNIYEFPLFTEKFCKEAVALAETLDKWTQDRHEFYPTNDVLLPELGLDHIYMRVLREVVYPICIHLWQLEGRGWDSMFSENFMARYTTDRQSHLSLHHDFSHVTMVVKLNDEFEGGGTWFPKYKTLSNPAKVGTATLHPGMITHLHGARPISAGKRYICVSFMRKEIN
jgi:GR25 family glycosyltransferase involved in LPS biosynthesis